MSVDLPAPFSPTIACTSPGMTSRSTPSRTRLPTNALPTPSARSRGGRRAAASPGPSGTTRRGLLFPAGIGSRLEIAPAAADPLVCVRLNYSRAVRKNKLLSRKLIGLLARDVLAHELVDRRSQADIGDVRRVVPVSLESPRLDGFEAGVRAVERIVLDAILAAVAARNGELSSPGGFLGVGEDGVDLRIGREKVFHDRHGRITNPLSIAGREHLDFGIFREDVLHALIAIDRRG